MNTVKLEDIARELHLSVSTVSRAINGKGRVGEKTRVRVLDAVRKSGYRVNEVAQSLRMKTVRSVGIIVPDVSNSFFGAIIKGAQQRCRQDGYSLIVCSSDEDPEIEGELLQSLLGKQLSGLILGSVVKSSAILGTYGSLDIPVVYIDNMPLDTSGYDSVSIDNRTAAVHLTNELLDRGYARIGMITGPSWQSTGLLRRQGFESALCAKGSKARPEWVRTGGFTLESGYDEMNAVLNMPDHPDAMLIANNYMAYGAIRAIREAGLTVPGDIAVAAFDADDPTGLIAPSISSVNQPAQRIGTTAMEILLQRLSEPLRPEVHVCLEPICINGSSW